jgi:hypothetical protein
MRAPLALSTFMHVAIFVVAWLGFPYDRPSILDTPPILEVEVVTEAEAKPAAPEPEPEKQVAALPQPAPAPEPAPPPPPEPEAIPVPPAPDEKIEPEPEPKPEAKPKPEPKPEEKKAEKPKPKPQAPRPRLKPKPPKKDEFESVLKSVEKLEERKKHKAAKPEKKPRKERFEDLMTAAVEKSAEKAKKAPVSQIARLGDAVSQSDKDAVRRQLEPCWNPPVGAPKAEDLIVELRMDVLPDGRIAGAPEVLNAARMSSNRYFQAAADAAVRAVLNPRCQPLKLPPEKYEDWKVMIITFDPSEMLGR